MVAPSPTTSRPGGTRADGSERGKRRWTGSTRGGVAIIAFGTTFMRWMGWRGAYLISFPLTLAYWLIDGVSRRESIRYWRHIRPEASYLDHWLWAFQHLSSWGLVLCDRQLFYHKAYSYSGSGLQPMRDWVRPGRGCILLSAHVGNWELSAGRVNAVSKGRTSIVRVVDDSPMTRRLIEGHMKDTMPDIIDPRDGMAAVFQIRSALEQGRTVCMLGDRQLDLQPGIRVPFLNGTAVFSTGPFLMAGLTGVPIVIGFFMKRSRTHYHIEVDPPLFIDLPKKGPQRDMVLRQAVEAWAKRLEAQVRKYPIQWHNFFDFWA